MFIAGSNRGRATVDADIPSTYRAVRGGCVIVTKVNLIATVLSILAA
jgi:hypothetical protein